jgi:transposase
MTVVCVLDREGVVVRERKAASTAEAIAGELAKAPSCRRIVFETGRMAPILFHELNQPGLPVVCVESRQAYQALKSLATRKTDRNDARGLAHLARTGFFKPVHACGRSGWKNARRLTLGRRMKHCPNQMALLLAVASPPDPPVPLPFSGALVAPSSAACAR